MENLLFAYFGENGKGIEGKMHTHVSIRKMLQQSRKDCAT
jgi:hypothetical protein